MTSVLGLLRRSIWLVLLTTVGGLAFTWWRERSAGNQPAPAEWPPLRPEPATSAAATSSSAVSSAEADESSTSTSTEPDEPTSPSSGTASEATAAEATTTPASAASAPSIVPKSADATADAETAASTTVAGFASTDSAEAPSENDWIEPNDDGSCPLSHPIKANDNSGIFHVPDGRFYKRTKAERCYVSSEAAAADGYRQAKN